MKKIILLLTLLPLFAQAGPVLINGIYYNLETSSYTAEVTNTSGGNPIYADSDASYTSSTITIPSTVTYNGMSYNVTSISQAAFSHCIELTSVNIPNSVTYIGDYAFSFCDGLTSVNIPNSVTYIGEDAFYCCYGLTSVNIPNSVTAIGHQTFGSCSRLTSVNIPNSVTSIGDWAFSHCSGLTSVNIPNSVTYIGERAFSGCSGLTSVNIPESVTSIGIQAFSGCSGLTSVNIPNSVTAIGGYAFSGTPWFNNQPDGVVYAGKVAYKYKGTMPSNTSITLEEGTTGIAGSAFSGCSGLTSVTIPNSVNSIGDYAFYGCSGLTSVDIPNSVTSIDDYSFQGCSGLKTINIPSSVTSIGDSAFSGTPWFNNQPDGVVYAGKVAYKYKGTMPSNTSITLEEGTTGIAGSAFFSLTSLTSVNIPNSVTSIGNRAFQGCSGLTSVTIPNSVTSIGSYAFSGCSGLTSVNISDLVAWCNISFNSSGSNPLENAHHLYLNGTEVTDLVIPSSVTSIGGYAFSGCSGLTSVTIPNSVTAIGGYAFSGCSSLQEVVCWAKSVPSATSNAFSNDPLSKVKLSLSNVKLLVLYQSIDCYRNLSPWKNFGTISTIDVQKNGFYYLFDSPKEEATITGVADNPFGHLNIPSYVVYEGVDYDVVAIYDNAFQNCSNITSINIPNSVTAIGNGAFEGCSGLTDLSIGKKIKSIGQNAFKGCSDLNSITVASGNTVYDSRNNCNAIIETATGKLIKGCNTTVIPNDVTSIGENAFQGCSGLTFVNIHENVTSIGIQAFNGCNGLTSVTIDSNDIISADRTENDNLNSIFGSQVKEYVVGEDVTAIGQNAFRGITNLTTVSVGKNIDSIGDNAFYGCSNLATFTCYAADIPTANSSVFEGIDLTYATLYVPASALEDYEETKPWRRFGTILPIDENAVPTAIDTAAADDYKEYFDRSGHRVTSTQRGLLIVRDRSGKTRKVMVK